MVGPLVRKHPDLFSTELTASPYLQGRGVHLSHPPAAAALQPRGARGQLGVRPAPLPHLWPPPLPTPLQAAGW